MNAAITRFLRTFNAYYDKVFALAVLLILLFSLLILLLRVSTDKAEHEGFTRDLMNLAPEHPQPAGLDVTLFRESRAQLHAPLQIAPWDRRVATPEMRVYCVNCERPIPYEVGQCPYCGSMQPDDPAPATDWDRDGMPDIWEEQYGLDPRDPSDAGRDLDGDGFSNLEEYLFGTDPTDPSDFPAPWVRLRVDKIESDPFNMRFMGVSRIGEKQLFQLNLRAGGRTYWAELGDVVEGFSLTGYEERLAQRQGLQVDVSVLTLRRGDLDIPLVKGEITPHLQHRAVLVFEIGGGRHDVVRGGTLTLKGQRYDVMQIDPEARRVQLQNTDNETLWVTTVSASARKISEVGRP